MKGAGYWMNCESAISWLRKRLEHIMLRPNASLKKKINKKSNKVIWHQSNWVCSRQTLPLIFLPWLLLANVIQDLLALKVSAFYTQRNSCFALQRELHWRETSEPWVVATRLTATGWNCFFYCFTKLTWKCPPKLLLGSVITGPPGSLQQLLTCLVSAMKEEDDCLWSIETRKSERRLFFIIIIQICQNGRGIFFLFS